MARNFCAGTYPWGKTAKALPTRGQGWPSVLRAYKTPIFAKGQKLTHSPAHVEKHAGQETPLLYTPYLQWHHPGGRALLQLAQVPTQDYHSYTHALLGGIEGEDKSPSGSPVRVQENTELLSVSAANPHLLRFSQICPRLTTFWSFSLLRRNRRLAAQSQDQTYIFLICRI